MANEDETNARSISERDKERARAWHALRTEVRIWLRVLGTLGRALYRWSVGALILYVIGSHFFGKK